MLNSPIEYQRMAASEQNLWWYRCLHKWVLDTLRSENISKEAAILDAGCGTGGLLRALNSSGFRNLRGFDKSPHAVEIAQQHAQIELLSLEEIESKFSQNSLDVITCNDVFYFIPEQFRIEVLQKFRNTLVDSGLLIINMPVYQTFAGIHDRSVGLKTRISPAQLQMLCEKADFRVVSSFCWPFILSPLIASTRWCQRAKLKSNPNTEIISDISVPPWIVNESLFWITQIERTLQLGFFGSSNFLVLKKTS